MENFTYNLTLISVTDRNTYVIMGSGEPPMLLHVISSGLSSVAMAILPGDIIGGWGGVKTVKFSSRFDLSKWCGSARCDHLCLHLYLSTYSDEEHKAVLYSSKQYGMDCVSLPLLSLDLSQFQKFSTTYRSGNFKMDLSRYCPPFVNTSLSFEILCNFVSSSFSPYGFLWAPFGQSNASGNNTPYSAVCCVARVHA
uniref:Uncharacterized protein n=1 Tax=Glossina pallidipes TaxID=7398 RepID=A0A1A9ZPT6_GLOPL